MATAAVATPDAPKPPRPALSLRPRRERIPRGVAIVEPTAKTDQSGPADISTASPDLKVTSTPWSKKLILTLDGGGIRGYSALITLDALMDEISRIEQSLEPRATSSASTPRIPSDAIPADVYKQGEYLPCHYFDYIAGTSFGGLIAIMLGMLSMSVKDCIAEFHRQSKAIPRTNHLPSMIDFQLLHRRTTWPTKRTCGLYETFARFSATAAGRAIPGVASAVARTIAAGPPSPSHSQFTASSSSSEFKKDSLQCQTLAWCSEIENRERRPHAFCSYEEYDTHTNSTTTTDKLISIAEVAKAITTPWSASFKPFKLGAGQFVDGSRQIRDPTVKVLKEITALVVSDADSLHRSTETPPPIELLLSLGTDEHHAWFYEKLLRSRIRRAPSPAPAPTTTKDRVCRFHHRFEAPDIRLGLRRRKFLSEIEEQTKTWLCEPPTVVDIRRYARMLVELRRARAATTRWETFALGVRYRCFHDNCFQGEGEEPKLFDSRGKFFNHLDRNHGLSRRASVDVEGELDRGRRFGYAPN